ncbi:MAG: hypothetical protein ACI4M9_03970 [Succinivibrio sp.]
MKVFNEKDLITWSNRDQAIVGYEYYFCDNKAQLNDRIRASECNKLHNIESCDIKTPFVDDYDDCYACILPIDAVKETEPEKKYRACRSVKELYMLVREIDTIFEENTLIFNLLHNTILHIRRKDDKEVEVYSFITKIIKRNDTFVIGIGGGIVLAFDELFGTFEIEVNGNWQPFGVLEE